MRVFLAFPIPAPTLEYIVTLQDWFARLGVTARWSPPANSHFTVAFLGEQSASAVTALAAALHPVCAARKPWQVMAAAPNTFGHPPRVLYLDWRENSPPTFQSLATDCIAVARKVGMELPNTQAHATIHLTLARFKSRQDAATLKRAGEPREQAWQWPESMPQPDKTSGTVCFSELILYKSTLHPNGANYDIIANFPFRQ